MRKWCLLVAALSAAAFGQSGKKVQVEAWVARNVAPGPKIRLNINTTNVPAVSVSAYRVNPIEWLSRPDREDKAPKVMGPPIKSWNLTIADPKHPPTTQVEDAFYTRQVNLPPLPSGVYMLDIRGRGASKWVVVNVTNLAVVAKESPSHLLVWVTDATHGQVLAGSTVVVYDQKGHELKRCRTGSDGVAFTTLAPGEHNLVVMRDGDNAGISLSAEDPNNKLSAFFETDRPIYRPGQSVQFKSILRFTKRHDYGVIANKPVQMEIRDPKNNPVQRFNLRTNSMGSVSGSFDVPEDGEIGSYSIVLSYSNETSYHSFSVAEYRKPEYKVSVTPVQTRYLAGNTIQFRVDAQYYFNAPVAGAEVRYTVRRSPTFWRSPESGEDGWYQGDGNLYERDTYSANAFVAEDTVHTDEHGAAVIDLKTDPKQPDSDYSIECRVTDSSRRQVPGGAAVSVYAANIRIALATDVVFVPLGKLLPVRISIVDLDGKPRAGNVTLVLSHMVWDKKKKDFYEAELARTRASVPSTGKLVVNLPAKAQGEFVIKAYAPDGTGRVALAALASYAVGPFEKEVSQETPEVTLKLNKRNYATGDDAVGYVTTNIAKRPILLVLEGDDIWSYRVVSGPSSWKFKTSSEMTPNAYFTAAVWQHNQLQSANEILPLPDKKKLLKVVLTPDKAEYRPGDKATYKVRTVNQSGQPVSAEVALGVVDEAIYALAPESTGDIYRFYWGRHPNRVSLAQSAPEELSGGAYQNVKTNAPLRQRFEDTAYWNPTILTDANGEGKITFEVPGNLTTWRATARAVDASTAVGAEVEKVVATRPVTLRLATPRQLVVGDHLKLIGTVNNRTSSSHQFVVALKAEGLKVNSSPEQTVSVPGQSSALVVWDIEADHLGAQAPAITATLDSTDKSVELNDALRVVVPVVPDGIQEHILTGGVLNEHAKGEITLPADKIEPASKLQVKIWSGAKPILDECAQAVLESYRYSTTVAADQLVVAASTGLTNDSKPVREALASLSKNQSDGGWGYWYQAQPNPVVTARVLTAFAQVKGRIEVPDQMVRAAGSYASQFFNQTNLWEYRALLASSFASFDAEKGGVMVEEVAARGIHLSPYAKLRVASALLDLKKTSEADKLIDDVVSNSVRSPDDLTVKVGDGIGWSASSTETTAELLHVLLKRDPASSDVPKLVRSLTSATTYWSDTDDQAAIVVALSQYLKQHPPAGGVGQASISIGGHCFVAEPTKIGEMLVANITAEGLPAGANQLDITRSGSGEVFYQVRATVYRPSHNDTDRGIKVVRRYEVKNAAGMWEILNRPVKAGEPVRCSILVWGDERADLAKVTEPIPAGFEFVDSDQNAGAKQEVRDGAVIHYLICSSAPQFFRYYIRAESEGTLKVLPTSAEVLKRPDQRGQTEDVRFEVHP